MIYVFNEQASRIGDRLMQHHPHLIGLKIAYLFKQKPEPKMSTRLHLMRAGKKVVLGKACLVPKKYTELLAADYKFLLEFDEQRWDELSLEQQEALVDHELSHCGNDADGCYLKSHDVEEFRAVVQRHGLWKSDIEEFAAVLGKQRELPLDTRKRREPEARAN